MIANEIRLLLVAVQFLTRIPVPSFDGFEPVWLDRSVKYFPAVGALVGAIAALVLWLASLAWPQPIPAVLAVAAAALVTGAFHEDGLADTADGLGGGSSRERRLEIMKDSRIGTYGTLAVLFTALARIAALAVLPVATAMAALVAVHALARLGPVLMIRFSTYAGDEGAAKVKPLATGVRSGELALAAATAAAIALGLLGPAAAAAALAGALAGGLPMACLAQRLLGGYTGDALGAIEQAVETGAVLAVAAIAR